MGQTLKYGIVGLGWIGMVHAEAIRAAVPDAEVAAVCDVLPDRLEEKAAQLSVARRFTDYREMIRAGGLDGVYVCVPNNLHRDVTCAALSAGMHVFCEKPMALNAREACEMADAASRAGLLLQVGMVNRLRPESRIVKQYAAEGFFGSVPRMTVVIRRHRGVPGLGGWFTTKSRAGGGCLIDIGVHLIDLVMWLTGKWAPTAASAATSHLFGVKMRDYRYVSMWAGPPLYDGVCDVEDGAAGLVRFDDGSTLSLDVSWALNAREEAYVEILGGKAGVRMLLDGTPTLITEMDGRLVDLTPHFPREGNIYHGQAANFAAAVRGREKPIATAAEGVTVMELIEAIYRSAAEGREVPVR